MPYRSAVNANWVLVLLS